MLDIDTAIKHCLEVAEKNETSAITYKNCKEIKANMYEKLTAEKAENDCRECAADHRQLAEWLTELKELEAKHWDECRQIAHYDDDIKSLKAQIAEFKRCVKSDNSDYLTGYISALSAVEGMIEELIGGSENG